jgi:glycerol kinase
MLRAVLALDAGTTSSRAILFDERGAVLAVAQREFPQLYPQPGSVEHDAEEIWRTQIEVAAECIAQVPGVSVAAIGITNQRETTVVWDRASGRPIANAIVWQDRRTAAYCDELRAAGHEPLVRARTGLLLDPYFSGTKIRWLLDQVDTGDRDLAFGTIDSWLIWNLTRGATHVTDVTNASRTLLFDIHRCAWDDELLSILGIPRSLLPEVRASSEVVAVTAEGLPIPAGIPIAGIAGDQQAALFGQRCTQPGHAKNTYGTGSFIVMNTGTAAVTSQHGLLSTIAWKLPNAPAAYAVEGSIFVTGAAVQWLRDALGIIDSAAAIQALAASVPDTNGVVFVPAFTGLGTPHWDAYARGTIVGLTRGATKAHLARATLEAIALQTVDVLEAMRADSGIALTELRVDGGASRDDLLMQMQADLANLPVIRAGTTEITALGAAYLAGLAVGFWRDESEIDAQWTADRTFTPRMNDDQRATKIDAWRRAVALSKSYGAGA